MMKKVGHLFQFIIFQYVLNRHRKNFRHYGTVLGKFCIT